MHVTTMPHVQTELVIMNAPVSWDLLEQGLIAQVIPCLLEFTFAGN